MVTHSDTPLWQKAERRALRRVRPVIGRSRHLVRSLRLVAMDPEAGPRTVTRTLSSSRVTNASGTIPVIMCVWRRPERLDETIRLLERQGGPSVELHVWNNNRRAAARVESALSGSSLLARSVTHSAANVGGFGRFYLARELAERHPFVIFIDDDVTFPPTMTRELAAEFREASISSFWAFRLLSRSNFWSRDAAQPGERADYCGTGGMVVDTRVFLEPALFACPRRFWFVEDLWLSYFAAHVLGWTLRKSAVPFELTNDGFDQYHYLGRTKSRLVRHLVREGWCLPDAGR